MPQPEDPRAADKAWFVYSSAPGRFTAAPAGWKGWAALFAGIVANIGVGMLVLHFTEGLHPLLRLALFFAALVVGLLLIFRLAKAKGRPA